MEKDANRGLWTGLLVGTAIGIGIGLLYAPRTGSETREMLRKRADEMKIRAETFRNSVRERVGSTMHMAGGDGSGTPEGE